MTEHQRDNSASTPLIAPLGELGAESSAERSAKRIVPWLGSALLHAALVLAGFFITWSAARTPEAERPPVIVADFTAPAYDPVVPPNLPVGETLEESPPIEIDVPVLDQNIEAAIAEISLDASSLSSDSAPLPTGSDFAPPAARGSVSFLGLSTSNARRIVYVIDASGSMIAYLQIILQELGRSLESLTPQQSFGIVFFQRSEALVVPPPRRLMPATPDAKSAAMRWIDANVIPAGRSNPVAAFEAAMRLNPDVIFLLSDRIRGSGIYEIDQDELMAQLERLNPKDRVTGQRRTQINAIQFLDPDPLGTLELIARQHGGAEGRGYRFISRAELGLAEP
ncbi:MAG TPA: hypothetical protein PK098_07615 [Phycisphaerales bacterium]|nr:hypothetical protein [Phycisphaerales bacterium]